MKSGHFAFFEKPRQEVDSLCAKTLHKQTDVPLTWDQLPTKHQREHRIAFSRRIYFYSSTEKRPLLEEFISGWPSVHVGIAVQNIYLLVLQDVF